MTEVTQPTERSLKVLQIMLDHVATRLRAALTRLEGKDDAATRKRKEDAQEKYQLASILEKGGRAAPAIALASHTAKGIHPDLKVKEATNLAVDFSGLPSLKEIGSHVLAPGNGLMDTTGDGAYNAAAYELYLLLDCPFEGQTLGSLLASHDDDVMFAFSQGTDGETDKPLPWSRLLDEKCPKPAVHGRSKQIYWLAKGVDPSDDKAYEILAPLYPASLVHEVYKQVHQHRFGETNKAARQARKDKKAYDGVCHEYLHLAVQKMGGTKPQNISHLNSERLGTNYLLASLPPVWRSNEIRLPVHASSVFEKVFIGRPQVRKTVRELRAFLASDPTPNLETRQRRSSLIDELLDEMVSLAGELQQALAPGWTRETERFERLVSEEQLWLDPLRTELPGEADFADRWLKMDWPAEVGKRFANWLNKQLLGQLPVGDAEAREWKKELLTDEDGFVQQLRELRKRLDAPAYIPIRKTHDELVGHKEGAA
ncbi:CRISPR type I-F/YPEST-associated protein Csy1 [Delftia tsuruhatensis]|uniref:type I-F CRISPR-associated protein Csy1 n=1 Tax=Delftia tsuruhatensis TaxID=180282 RepID=UPI001E6D623E|nr:type I-F CRISPR-associated protein Csy1 [Delftia tsuruhatensis]CAB5718291.1 CRISPR type I-F/YPEST-associated protein Csy1 [Delftia tsuruhatensis]CAC9692433.1 CRISPR type I-F/YPEST-associated protein Csy1 [Delftia tsuruhatensis]